MIPEAPRRLGDPPGEAIYDEPLRLCTFRNPEATSKQPPHVETETTWRIEYLWDNGVDVDWTGYATTTGQEATVAVLKEMREATTYPWRAVRIFTTRTVEAW